MAETSGAGRSVRSCSARVRSPLDRPVQSYGPAETAYRYRKDLNMACLAYRLPLCCKILPLTAYRLLARTGGFRTTLPQRKCELLGSGLVPPLPAVRTKLCSALLSFARLCSALPCFALPCPAERSIAEHCRALQRKESKGEQRMLQAVSCKPLAENFAYRLPQGLTAFWAYRKL